ncbi:hypothetical protein MTR_2g095090 [Medicago truncatula]|uniref:Uncharacterized protein n=1 Tax=Medicago truncatula TaxID=3880 RepID=A0A072VMN1_MEDTR|nr:hypothetical protein MTR_2g095090 [Medicago truncatula]
MEHGLSFSAFMLAHIKSCITSFHLREENLRNHIHIILEMEKDQYGTEAKLFRIYARSQQVLHHNGPLLMTSFFSGFSVIIGYN